LNDAILKKVLKKAFEMIEKMKEKYL